MAYAISIKVTGSTAEPILALWDEVSNFESSPSMAPLNYPPHITLAVYDDIDPDRLTSVVADGFGQQQAFHLRFTHLCYFDARPLVLWAAPLVSPALAAIHSRVHLAIDPDLCRPHYRPGAWIPHCTIATQIADDHRTDAIAFTAKPFNAFNAVFDIVDCVSFPPVTVLREHIFSHC